LRFNFRGVGLSEGVHDKGRGEQEDVRASLDYLATEFPGRPILVAGFSFGSVVGLRVGCTDARVAESIGLGLPVKNSDFGFLQACPKPKLIVQGGSDKFGSRKNIESVFATMSEPKRLVIVESADHFFTGQIEKVGAAIGYRQRATRGTGAAPSPCCPRRAVPSARRVPLRGLFFPGGARVPGLPQTDQTGK